MPPPDCPRAARRRGRARGLGWGVGLLLPALLLLAGTYFLFVKAPPPRTIAIAAGSRDGAYYRHALRYAELLRQDGITLEVRETRGSVENLRLLADGASGVGVAILQSGVAEGEAAEQIAALGSLYHEPLWIFYRGHQPLQRVSELAGKRLAVGPPGSGTRAAALEVLRANGLVPGPGGRSVVTLLDSTGTPAAEALRRGDLDAAFFVAAIETPYVQELLTDEGVRLMSLSEQEAYRRRFPQFAAVTVPAGLADLGKNLPARDTALIAPNAVLVVRKDFYPELVALLLSAAARAHGRGTLLARPGEFPSREGTGLDLDENARHYYEYGPPVLQRYLPFWLALEVDRLKVMLIPLVVLLMPLLRLTPPLLRWRVRRKIYRWYGLLRDIDDRLRGGMSLEELRGELARLREIEGQVADVDVPLSYGGEFHDMRFHLSVVRGRLERLLAEKGEPRQSQAG